MTKFFLLATTALLAACAISSPVPTTPASTPSTTTQPTQPGSGSKPVFNRAAIAPAFVQATNAFGFKLLNELSKANAGQNIFISPASVALALALANNGANGETQKAIAQVLGTPSLNLQEANIAYANLQGLLHNADPKVKLDIANSVWARKSIALKPDFVQRAQQFFNAEATSLDFANPASVERINAWVKQNTQGKIAKIVEPPIAPETMLFLINAIYFKGGWSTPFDKSLTQDRPFNLPSGQQKAVPMMQRDGKMDYLRGEGFQAVRLPYADGAISMAVLLPNAGTNLDQFRTMLSSETWATWQHQFARKTGSLALPKFKLEYGATLNTALKAMGMSIAFDPKEADFSGLHATPPNLFISAVAHKTFVEVNEEGTEAAAATSVTVGLTMLRPTEEPFTLIVDRPFFVAIQDNQTGAILFSGLIVAPN